MTTQTPPQCRVVTATGLLDGVTFHPSPNCDERPAGTAIDLIVVHGISLPPGEYGGPWIERLFLNTLPADRHPYFVAIAAMQVSTHLLIRRTSQVIQYVPFHRRAWHAGQSCFQGRHRCNDFSIGIELEGSDDVAYEDAQYSVLRSIITALRAAYPAIAADRICGHSDIAPGRKTDPGPAFDWDRV